MYYSGKYLGVIIQRNKFFSKEDGDKLILSLKYGIFV
jgi:hypothetical protein